LRGEVPQYLAGIGVSLLLRPAQTLDWLEGLPPEAVGVGVLPALAVDTVGDLFHYVEVARHLICSPLGFCWLLFEIFECHIDFYYLYITKL
jgi:hypothetical protein